MNGSHLQLQNGEGKMSMGEREHFVKLTRVTKIFGKGSVDEVAALAGIDLGVAPEDFVTIIGSNGAGKTTLLNVIAGVFPPEWGGQIVIDGTDMTHMSEHLCARYVGRVHQDPNLGTCGKLTIEENLALALLRAQRRTLRPASSRKRRELFRSALAPLKLGLEDRLDAVVSTLSGGQRQAVALTMATISRPALLLLDEHVANLDPKTAQIVLDLTEMVVERERLTTLMITHNMQMALRYGNRLIMMHRGKIIVDLGGEDKKRLTIQDLIDVFGRAAGEQLVDEAILLSRSEFREPDLNRK